MPVTPPVNNGNPATGYVETTDALVQQVKTWLSTFQTTWNVVVFSGTSKEDIAGFCQGLRAPAAVVMYTGSNWRVEPKRREASISVVVINDNHQIESGGPTVRGMLDSAVGAIDGQLLNQAYFRADSDLVVDLGVGKGAIELKIHVEDN